MDIIGKIKKLTYQKGWTIYQLSNEANIGQSTITNMFTRQTLPSITTLTKICNALGITLSQFFQEKNEVKDLSFLETELINEFRKLSLEKQNLLVNILRQ